MLVSTPRGGDDRLPGALSGVKQQRPPRVTSLSSFPCKPAHPGCPPTAPVLPQRQSSHSSPNPPAFSATAWSFLLCSFKVLDDSLLRAPTSPPFRGLPGAWGRTPIHYQAPTSRDCPWDSQYIVNSNPAPKRARGRGARALGSGKHRGQLEQVLDQRRAKAA